MLRERFPSDRVARVVGWTAVSVAWGAAVATRALGAPGDEPATVPASTAESRPEAAAVAPSPTTLPDLPPSGLTVIRVAPTTVAPTVASPRSDDSDPAPASPSPTRPPATVAPAPATAPPAPAAPAPPPAVATPPPADSGGS